MTDSLFYSLYQYSQNDKELNIQKANQLLEQVAKVLTEGNYNPRQYVDKEHPWGGGKRGVLPEWVKINDQLVHLRWYTTHPLRLRTKKGALFPSFTPRTVNGILRRIKANITFNELTPAVSTPSASSGGGGETTPKVSVSAAETANAPSIHPELTPKEAEPEYPDHWMSPKEYEPVKSTPKELEELTPKELDDEIYAGNGFNKKGKILSKSTRTEESTSGPLPIITPGRTVPDDAIPAPVNASGLLSGTTTLGDIATMYEEGTITAEGVEAELIALGMEDVLISVGPAILLDPLVLAGVLIAGGAMVEMQLNELHDAEDAEQARADLVHHAAEVNTEENKARHQFIHDNYPERNLIEIKTPSDEKMPVIDDPITGRTRHDMNMPLSTYSDDEMHAIAEASGFKYDTLQEIKTEYPYLRLEDIYRDAVYGVYGQDSAIGIDSAERESAAEEARRQGFVIYNGDHLEDTIRERAAGINEVVDDVISGATAAGTAAASGAITDIVTGGNDGAGNDDRPSGDDYYDEIGGVESKVLGVSTTREPPLPKYRADFEYVSEQNADSLELTHTTDWNSTVGQELDEKLYGHYGFIREPGKSFDQHYYEHQSVNESRKYIDPILRKRDKKKIFQYMDRTTKNYLGEDIDEVSIAEENKKIVDRIAAKYARKQPVRIRNNVKPETVEDFYIMRDPVEIAPFGIYDS